MSIYVTGDNPPPVGFSEQYWGKGADAVEIRLEELITLTNDTLHEGRCQNGFIWVWRKPCWVLCGRCNNGKR